MRVAPAPLFRGARDPRSTGSIEGSAPRTGRFEIADIGYLATAAALMGAGYRLWQDCRPGDNPEIMALDLLCYAAAFAVVLNLRRQFLGSYTVLAGALLAFLAQAYGVLTYEQSTYRADSILFNHYSASLFMQGLNPYVQSMLPAYQILGVPTNVMTPSTNGDAIHSLSYPALSFLVYAPFLFLNVTNMLWVSVTFHALAIVSLFCVSPPRVRFLAPLLLSIDPSYFNYTMGGVTDIIWLPPMIVAAYYWERNVFLSAAMLGLACSLKQNAWLVIPFALIHWVYEARRTRRLEPLAVPITIVCGIFLATNLPFILSSPGDWARGVVAPLAASPIPFGSGVVQILPTIDVPASILGPLWLTVLAVMMLVYARFKRQVDFLPFIAPAIALFFASRSLQNYFMYWPPVVLAYVVSNARMHATHPPFPLANVVARFRVANIVVALAGALLVTLFIGSFAKGLASPIGVRVIDPSFDAETGAIDAFRIAIRDDTDRTKRVRLAIFSDNKFSFWNHGFPVALDPHAETSVVVRANGADDELRPVPGQNVQIVAVDTETGRETFSERKRFYLKLEASAMFDNGDLARWRGRSRAPVGWNYDAAQLRARVVDRAVVENRPAIRFTIPASRQSGWHLASVNQIVPAAFGKLIARIYPSHDFTGGPYPTGFFGVELIDGLNHHYIISIDSHATKSRVLVRNDGTTYEIRPGRLNAWNDIPVDLERLSKQTNFAVGGDAYLSFNVTSAVYGMGNRTTHDAFGGVVAAK